MSEIKKQNNKCSHPKCGREVFENGKCILHCDKDDWFEVMPSGQKLWNNEKQIILFWEEFNNYKHKYIFNIIFPVFLQMYQSEGKLKSSLFNNFKNQRAEGRDFNLEFNNCLFYGKTFFPSNLNNLVISDSIFFSEFEISSNSNVSSNIKIDDVEFKENVKIENFSEKLNKLEIYKTTFKKLFNFVGYSKRFLAKKCNFNKSYLSINPNGKAKPDFEFIETTFNKEFYFTLFDIPVNILMFDYCNIHSSFNVSSKGNSVDSCSHYENSHLDLLRFFHCDLKSESVLNINVQAIHKIRIEEVKYSGKIIIKDINKNDIIVIKDSNIPNTILMNCFLNDSDITIVNSSLFASNNYLVINNISWPTIENFHCNRDTFRQLKIVNDKQANYIEANKFYSAEMEEYHRELIDKDCKASPKEKFVFNISYLISDFSRDWVLPIIWFFVFGFLFAFIYYLNIADINNQNFVAWGALLLSITIYSYDYFAFNNIRSSLFLLFLVSGINYFMNTQTESIKKLIFFMNPLNTSGLNNNDACLNTSDLNYCDERLIWWILFRIISIFIIYQFVTALRRQTRR